jgi:hypothetical protein
MRGFDVGFISASPKNIKKIELETEDYEQSKINREKQIVEIQKQTDRLSTAIGQYNFTVLAVTGFWAERYVGEDKPYYESLERSFMVVNDRELTTEAFVTLFNRWIHDFDQSAVLIKPASSVEFNGKVLEAEIGYTISDNGEVTKLGKVNRTSLSEWKAYGEGVEARGGSQTIGTHDEFAFSFVISGIEVLRGNGDPSPITRQRWWVNAIRLNAEVITENEIRARVEVLSKIYAGGI